MPEKREILTILEDEVEDGSHLSPFVGQLRWARVVAGADATQHLSQIFSERQRLLCVNKLKQRKVLVAIKDSKCVSYIVSFDMSHTSECKQPSRYSSAKTYLQYMLELLNWEIIHPNNFEMAATKGPDLELPAVYDKDDWQSPIATTSCQDLPRRFSKPLCASVTTAAFSQACGCFSR
jgi:hypothetical protein